MRQAGGRGAHRRGSAALALLLALAGCAGAEPRAGEDGAVSGDAGAQPDASVELDGALSEVPFERPDAAQYTPKPGSCGLEKPAFCDSFETIADDMGRTGELDDERWSAARAGPWEHPDLDTAFGLGPAKLPACRAGLPPRALAEQDTRICDPQPGIPTRHLLTATAAQNYGLNSYRIRQPFDFAGRTGTIKLDVDASNDGLGGWPALVIAADPAPAPSFDWEERGSGPQNGVSVELLGGWCNTPNTLEVGLFTFRDYVQTAHRPSFDCATPHARTARDRLNHVEIYLTRKRLEVWVSDSSPDGVDFPNLQLLYALDLDLPFERGYLHLLVRNHATMKYWRGSAWAVRWDNVGFDGPVVSDVREHSARDSQQPTAGLEGCLIDGVCRWRGDVIAEHPDDNTLCATSCKSEGEGRSVGYVVPNPDEAPVAITIPDVRLAGATGARLALAATYPWFDWNGVSKPPTAISLHYRLNGLAWHERPISDMEANAFTDFHPELGGAGHGAGLLNQIIELNQSELRQGDNLLELRGAGTWTGSYRIGVAAVDLILDTP